MAAFTWRGAATIQDVVNLGPLALIHPLLAQLDIESLIDRHLPADPQQEYSHGHVLNVLLMARLCQPTALMNVAGWAEKTGADILANIPAAKLNDDRLGRALDAFFDHRHSVLASVTATVLAQTGAELKNLHFDTTDIVLYGAYVSSQARPEWPTAQPFTGDAALPPAHLCHGYTADTKMLQAGQLAVVDAHGALPVLAHCLDGNRNGHTAIAQTVALAQHHLPLAEDVLFFSDRGTCSTEHLSRLHRHGYAAVCAAPWQDYRAVYEAHAEHLLWQQASFLSVEQRRRREQNSALPREHYELAVWRHTLCDPSIQEAIPARLIFVYSTALERECRKHRERNIARIQAGLEALQAKLERGHPQCTPASISRQVVQLLGKRRAANYFTWHIRPLTAEEQAALPTPRSGHRRAAYRLEFAFNAAAAQADERHDGLSVLVTTASPHRHSADALFAQYKQQNYLEALHHQWKTPLAVSPVFLKSPRRVEALVCLLQIALQAYQALERLYRQRVPSDEAPAERRLTSESLLRIFKVYGLLIGTSRLGRIVHTTRLSNRQKQILERLQFPTPAQTLCRILLPEPSG
jgi:transposase